MMIAAPKSVKQFPHCHRLRQTSGRLPGRHFRLWFYPSPAPVDGRLARTASADALRPRVGAQQLDELGAKGVPAI